MRSLKLCIKCKKRKPIKEFYKNKRRLDGLCAYCKACAKSYNVKYYTIHRKKMLRRSRKWNKLNPEKVAKAIKNYGKVHPEKVKERGRNQHLKKYKLTTKEYNRMVKAQGGVCAICGEPERMQRALSVDHDHFTGEVRGLVCSRCNSAMGFADDSPMRLRKMADYIERYLLKKSIRKKNDVNL